MFFVYLVLCHNFNQILVQHKVFNMGFSRNIVLIRIFRLAENTLLQILKHCKACDITIKKPDLTTRLS